MMSLQGFEAEVFFIQVEEFHENFSDFCLI